jgi:hypothetical protein
VTPQPGEQVLVVFPGTAEKIYDAGGQPDGAMVKMLPVRLPGGHLVYVPVVDGVAFLPGEQAAELAAAVNDGRQLWEPGPFVADCGDCDAAAGEYCSMHGAEADRAERYRRVLVALTAAGLDPEAAET